jgi:hypothetical protein
LFGTLPAATKHATQDGAGSGTGADAANAYSITQINAASPFSPSGDDTVILHGTFTTALVPPTSGTSGHPITFLFADSSAKFSKACWGSTKGAAICINGKNYITIDGASVGTIENTANGDSLENHRFSDGIYVLNATGCTVKNLTVQNIYVHTHGAANNPGRNALPYTVNCIYAVDSPSLEILSCTLHDAYTGLLYKMTTSGNQTAPYLYNVDISACSTGIVAACTASGQILNNLRVRKCRIVMGKNWYEVANENHIDGIHTWTGSRGNFGAMANLHVSDCHISGDPSTNCSGYIYISDRVVTAYIYNNLLVGATNRPNEGYLYTNLTGNCVIHAYNNTIKGLASDNTGGIGMNFSANNPSGTTTAHLKNNIVSTCYVGIYNPASTVSWDCDYNAYYNVGSVGADSGGFKTTLANWQAVSDGDTHSIITNPGLDDNHEITSGSPCYNTGTDVGAMLIKDRVGTDRLQSTAFDRGSRRSL